MRTLMMAAGLAALTLTACSQAEEKPATATAAAGPADSLEGPRPGLWRVSTTMAGMPGGASAPAVETCVTSTSFEMPNQGGSTSAQGATCTAGAFRREGDAMVGSSTCTLPGGMKTESTSRVTGDFSSNYTMEITTTMDPAPSPQMAETRMTMTAERLGDCPTGGAAAGG